LTIRKKYYSSNHAHIATSLANIDLVHHRQGKYDEALVLLREALIIQEKYYNYFHVDIIETLSNMGFILSNQKKYEEARNCQQRAMSIYKNYYQSDHVLTIFLIFFIKKKNMKKL
jgi:tetratricopeptide (TPR) repeat protein